MTESIELLPCPFCRGTDMRISCDDFGYSQFKIRSQAWWIQCQDKHCYALQQASTKEKVIARWNKRVSK